MGHPLAVATVETRAVRPVDRRAQAIVTGFPRYFLPLSVLIMLSGLLLRIWRLGTASLWTDEVLTAYRAESSFQAAYHSILGAGNQMPFYYLLMRLMPNASEVMMRLPSVLLGMCGISLIMAVVLRLYQNADMALWAGALVAFNPYHLWLSRTARYYTLIFVLSLVVSYCFLRLLRGHSSRRLWIVFVLGSLAAYLTHYTTLALGAAQFTVLAITVHNNRKLFWRWIAAQTVAVIPVVLWLLLLVTQNQPEVASEWVPRPQLLDLPLTLYAMTLGPIDLTDWAFVPGRIVVLIGLFFAPLWVYRRMQPEILYWLALFLEPLFLVYLLSVVVVPFYVDRYFMVALPALIILIVQSWTAQTPRTFRWLAFSAVILTGAATINTTFSRDDYIRDDWSHATRYVAQHIQPDDQVVVERDNIEQAFALYYPQTGRPMPPVARLADLPDTAAFEPSTQRVWLIYRNPNEDVHSQVVMPDFDPYEPGRSALGDWLIAHQAQVVAEQRFNGVTVLLLDQGAIQAKQ